MDDVSFELLKLYAQRDKLSIKDISAILNHSARSITEPVMHLADMKYLKKYEGVRKTGIFDISYMITRTGCVALEAELKSRKQSKHNEFRAWTAIGISVIALIISAISLLLQIL